MRTRQESFWGAGAAFRLGGLGLVGHGEGKDHREVGALTLHALHHDLPAHEPDQLVGDGHFQARSAKAAGGAGVLLLKGAENTVDELGIHADAGVVDPEHQIQRPLPQEHLAEGDGDLPLAGEFHRVGKEADDHLANSQLAAHHPVRRHAVEPDIAADVLGVQGLGKHIAELAAKGPQAEGLGFQLHLARLDAGHIENVVDETEKKLAELVGPVHILHGGVVGAQLAADEGEHAGDAVHGGADLVGHPEEEAGLELTGLLRLAETGLIFLIPLALLGDAAEDQKILHPVGRAAGGEPQPLAGGHLHLPAQIPQPAPVLIFPPEIRPVYRPVQPGKESVHSLPQAVQGHAQEPFQIADGLEGHPVFAAEDQADLILLAVELAEHEPIHRGNGGEPLPAAALPRPPSQQKEGGDELGTAHQDQAIVPAQSGEKLGQRIHRAPPFFESQFRCPAVTLHRYSFYPIYSTLIL